VRRAAAESASFGGEVIGDAGAAASGNRPGRRRNSDPAAAVGNEADLRLNGPGLTPKCVRAPTRAPAIRFRGGPFFRDAASPVNVPPSRPRWSSASPWSP